MVAAEGDEVEVAFLLETVETTRHAVSSRRVSAEWIDSIRGGLLVPCTLVRVVPGTRSSKRALGKLPAIATGSSKCLRFE